MQSLKIIEEKLKIKPSLALLLLFVVLLVLSPLLNTHALLTSVVCYLIPAYLSFIALESTDKEDDIRYLTYWIIFSFVEVSSPVFKLFFNKFTYMTFRILVTLALLHPLSSLANVIYNKFVRPFLASHQQEIDAKLDELAKEGKKKLAEGVTEGLQQL
jgi:receptor expression-enhancing protein 5/6